MIRKLNLVLAALVIGLLAFYGGRTVSRSDVITDFHRLFYGSADTWRRNRWLDVPTLQNPNDVWIIQEIIGEVRPDFVVETGTFHGGSATLWAMLLSQLNPAGRVITVDISDMAAEARTVPVFQERVDFLLGSSVDPQIVERIRSRVQGRKVVVILDSDHSCDHVLKEMEIYAPLVSVGSYMIVQDTNLSGHPVSVDDYPLGPMEAVDTYLTTHDNFVVDQSRERLLLTMNPRGYLRKVK